MTEINAVLFDLDGTLIDTAPDMASALNALLLKHGKQALPYEPVRNIVSKGGSALVRLGFGEDIQEEKRLALLQQFLDIYSASLCNESKLFDGVEELLNLFDSRQMQWGVVTNKPGWLTVPLLKQLDLFDRAACVVSGDTLDKRKPDPEPLLFACNKIGCPAQQAVYVGDDERDIIAGKAAGMHTLVAKYGYIASNENPQAWGATGIIASVTELKHWLNNSLYS